VAEGVWGLNFTEAFFEPSVAFHASETDFSAFHPWDFSCSI
jgi:hypothetical protein